MGRPQRQAALSARTRTRELELGGSASSGEPSEASGASSSPKDSEEDEAMDENESEAEEESESEDEPVARKSSSPRTPKQRGRPRSSPTPRRAGAYRRLDDYEVLEPGVRDLEFWRRCAEGARTVKRGVRKDKKQLLIGRPPVDLIEVAKAERGEGGGERRALDVPAVREEGWQPVKEEPDEITVNYNDRGLAVRIGTSQSADFVTFVGAGRGGVSALDWSSQIGGNQFLAISVYPRPDYVDLWALPPEQQPDDAPNTPIQIWRVGSAAAAAAERVAVIRHQFGVVRRLLWHQHASDTRAVLLALFSDGKARVFQLDTSKRAEFRLGEDALAVGEDDLLLTTATWCPAKPDLLYCGTVDGRILLYRVGGHDRSPHNISDHHSPHNPHNTHDLHRPQNPHNPHNQHDQCPLPQLLAGIRVSDKPVTSIAPCEELHVVGVGLHGAPAMVVDLTEPFEHAVLHSPLALVPLVRWSRAHGVFLFADSEQTVRAMSAELLVERTSFPIATFDVPVADLGVSELHNVVAAASSSGVVHLTHLDGRRSCLLCEQRILSLRLADGHIMRVDHSVGEPAAGKKDPANIPQRAESITHVRWSRSAATPGLLAVASGAVGLIVILPVDHLCLLPPGQ